jgi:hypothetical protein
MFCLSTNLDLAKLVQYSLTIIQGMKFSKDFNAIKISRKIKTKISRFSLKNPNQPILILAQRTKKRRKRGRRVQPRNCFYIAFILLFVTDLKVNWGKAYFLTEKHGVSCEILLR